MSYKIKKIIKLRKFPLFRTSTNLAPQMCPPTDHFNELERKMNGPGWKITSSSASCSEDELGANERDEFTFKMCQIIKKSHRYNKKHKHQHNKQKVSYLMLYLQLEKYFRDRILRA